jgi:hypothetical protein
LHLERSLTVRLDPPTPLAVSVTVANVGALISATGVSFTSFVLSRITIYPEDVVESALEHAAQATATYVPTGNSWAFQGTPGVKTGGLAYAPPLALRGPFFTSASTQVLVSGTNLRFIEFYVTFIAQPPRLLDPQLLLANEVDKMVIIPRTSDFQRTDSNSTRGSTMCIPNRVSLPQFF